MKLTELPTFALTYLFLLVIVAVIIITVYMFCGSANSEVIGEHTYNACLEECYRTHELPRLWRCESDLECAECMDLCMKELQTNAPEIAKKLNSPGKCFISVLGAEENSEFRIKLVLLIALINILLIIYEIYRTPYYRTQRLSGIFRAILYGFIIFGMLYFTARTFVWVAVLRGLL